MTARERLRLLMDERDTCGDEQAPPQVAALEMQLAASNIAALSLRVKRTEKRLDALLACPEIVAMLARAETRRTYL